MCDHVGITMSQSKLRYQMFDDLHLLFDFGRRHNVEPLLQRLSRLLLDVFNSLLSHGINGVGRTEFPGK